MNVYDGKHKVEIECPHCGQLFTVDANDFAASDTLTCSFCKMEIKELTGTAKFIRSKKN
jgi:hypothetical protein